GRMSVAFASELLRKFFGPESFHRNGVVSLKFLRPVKEGDTITISGIMNSSQPVEGGTLVTVDISCENQNGDKTAVGQGSAIVP
ncbi:MAG TPA: MaoC family dehydratase, partial [Dehalococcoidia bacterium]|nr:MaoC family dehydratase [Dehalococcoidia bacterium]